MLTDLWFQVMDALPSLRTLVVCAVIMISASVFVGFVAAKMFPVDDEEDSWTQE